MSFFLVTTNLAKLSSATACGEKGWQTVPATASREKSQTDIPAQLPGSISPKPHLPRAWACAHKNVANMHQGQERDGAPPAGRNTGQPFVLKASEAIDNATHQMTTLSPTSLPRFKQTTNKTHQFCHRWHRAGSMASYQKKAPFHKPRRCLLLRQLQQSSMFAGRLETARLSTSLGLEVCSVTLSFTGVDARCPQTKSDRAEIQSERSRDPGCLQPPSERALTVEGLRRVPPRFVGGRFPWSLDKLPARTYDGEPESRNGC